MKNNFTCIYKNDLECIADGRKCLGDCYPECDMCANIKSEDPSACKECNYKNQKHFYTV